MKTSTKISLKFTLFTILIVFFFGSIVNILFFQKRYARTGENHMRPTNKHTIGGGNFRRKMLIDKNNPKYMTLNKKSIYKNIYKIDTHYFYIKPKGTKIFIQDIESEIKAQKDLLYTTCRLMLFFGILSYIVSKYFVHSALRDLNTFIEHLQKLNLNNLQKLQIHGNPNDEINIVGKKINIFLQKIDQQSQVLKDFVANASHELRTPLMSMNSTIDYSLKAKKYKLGLEKNKQSIKTINTLIDELIMLTKIESTTQLETQRVNIKPIIQKIITETMSHFPDKDVQIKIHLHDVEKEIDIPSFTIIIKNIIENAFKYTSKGTISVTNTKDKITIKDTGTGIQEKNIEKIRDRFRQEDHTRGDNQGFGLGLSIVKTLVKKHKRKIEIKSEKYIGTECTIIF